MKLRELYEDQEVNLIGQYIDNPNYSPDGLLKIKITSDTPNKIWRGDFNCDSIFLTSLKGAPKEIIGNFRCYDNELKSYEYSPISVSGDFTSSTNNIETLEHCPKTIGKTFSFAFNKIKSFKHAPKKINGSLYCYNNIIDSLEHVPDVHGEFSCYNNKLTNLHDIHKMLKNVHGIVWLQQNPITSHVLGLLKIEGIRRIDIDNAVVKEILNKYLKEPYGNGRVIGCQSELLDAGLDEFAQL